MAYAMQAALPGFAQEESRTSAESAPAFSGLIMRQKEPANLEFPFAALERFIVPNELFYVRNHFPVPKLDAKSWRLKVEGAVERSLELTYDELTKMPSRSQVAVMECAGNSRIFLTPKAKGVLWENGAAILAWDNGSALELPAPS